MKADYLKNDKSKKCTTAAEVKVTEENVISMIHPCINREYIDVFLKNTRCLNMIQPCICEDIDVLKHPISSSVGNLIQKASGIA